jgi:hypothetical protein
MGSDRDIDDAIDHAVRDIMGVEPRAGLRARVLDRLERPRAGLFAVPRLAAAAAVVAIAVIAFFVMRAAPERIPAPEIAGITAPVAAPDTPPATVAAPTTTAKAEPAPRREVPRSAPRRPRTPAGQDIVEFPARGVVAAATVAGAMPPPGEAVDVVPMPLDPGAQPIAIEAIRIEPLAVERIVVAAIPPPR